VITIEKLRQQATSRDTGHRIPNKPSLGFYSDVKPSYGFDKSNCKELHQTELRIGVGYVLDPSIDPRQKERQKDLMVRQLHRHLYGEVENRAHEIMFELRYLGIDDNETAMVKVQDLLKELTQ